MGSLWILRDSIIIAITIYVVSYIFSGDESVSWILSLFAFGIISFYSGMKELILCFS